MADLGAKIRDYFKSDGIVENTIGSRIHAQQAPQGQTKPYARFTRVSNRFLYNIDHRNPWQAASVQFDCVGKTRTQAEGLVKDFIKSSSGLKDHQGIEGVFVQNVLDDFPDENSDGAIMRLDMMIQYTTDISTST